MAYRRVHIFEILFLLLKNQSIWPINIILLCTQIQDFFKDHFLFIGLKKVVALEVLEKEIKGLQRKKGLKKGKIWSWQLSVLYTWNFALFKCKIKLRKKMQSFFIIAKVNVGLIRGICRVNSHSDLNVKTLHAEMIYFY